MFVILLIISYILTLNYMVELDHADVHVNLMMNLGFSSQSWQGGSSGNLVARIISYPSRRVEESEASSSIASSSAISQSSRSNSVTLTPLNFLLNENEANKPAAEEPSGLLSAI